MNFADRLQTIDIGINNCRGKKIKPKKTLWQKN